MMPMSKTVKATIKDAAQKLTEYWKRAFMAKVAEDYFEGQPGKPKPNLGWNRDSVSGRAVLLSLEDI